MVRLSQSETILKVSVILLNLPRNSKETQMIVC